MSKIFDFDDCLVKEVMVFCMEIVSVFKDDVVEVFL